MPRNYRQERDFWLDHFYQLIDARRPNGVGQINPARDTVPIPAPMNVPLPIAGPCLIWRWGMTQDGYGQLTDGGYAHASAYLMSRGEQPRADWPIIRHLCNRPFCIQPSHLLPGTDAENKEDAMAARSDFYLYKTPARQGYHFWRSANADPYVWEPPPPPAMRRQTLPFIAPLECPHTFLKEGGVCANCGISEVFDHRRDCGGNLFAAYLWPCRCQEMPPCQCQFCVGERIMAQQRAAGIIPQPYQF